MNEVQRILGLDVGSKTIGVAVSDPLGFLAQGVTTIRRRAIASDLLELREIVALYNPERIVVGYPLSLSGQPGPQARQVEVFAESLAELELPIEMVDERFTTKEASRAMMASGMRADKRRELIDQQAAQLILQSYLDRRRRSQP